MPNFIFLPRIQTTFNLEHLVRIEWIDSEIQIVRLDFVDGDPLFIEMAEALELEKWIEQYFPVFSVRAVNPPQDNPDDF